MSEEMKFVKDVSFEKVVKDGFKRMIPGEGFEYTVGLVKGGTLKVVFEPPTPHCSVIIDGVNGFGYCMAFEE